jgi:Flp pilus assembly pilin Flp
VPPPAVNRLRAISLDGRRRTLRTDQAGLTTVEYIIVLCLIAVVGFAIWKQFGQRVEYKTKGATNVVHGLPTESSP